MFFRKRLSGLDVKIKKTAVGVLEQEKPEPDEDAGETEVRMETGL